MLKIVFGIALLVACASAASFSNCDRNAPVSINLKSIPDPLVIKAGSSIPIKATVNFRTQSPSRIKIHVKVYKKMWFYVKLPCIKNVGSCTYDVDCSVVRNICSNCPCPFPAGQRNFEETLQVPSISIPSFLANGQYKIKFDAVSAADNSRVACGELKVRIST